MAVLFLVLLVGLIILYSSHKQAVERLGLLERELDDLRHAIDAPARAEREAAAEALRARAAAAAIEAPPEPERAEAAQLPPQEPAEEAREPWEPESTPSDTFGNLFERFVGGRLLIWTGGIALAVAGVFLVRYSIEIGLATPRVRMILAALFGLGLVGAGEIARRRPGMAADPRIAQALVGAGIFVLYATVYGSMALYGLIAVAAASALMAAITASALALALRHGAPTAVMGLVGGFVTPLLVGDPDAGAVPLLLYLALLDAALFALAYRRGWTWLAAAATVLSFLWTGSLLVAAPEDALAGGLFIAALSVAAALARPGEGRWLRAIHPAAIGLLQLALLAARTDVGPAAWALYGALSAASLILAARGRDYWPLPPLALAFALALLALKTAGGDDPLVEEAAAAATALFGGFALWRRTPRLLWTAVATAAFAGPALILRTGAPELLGRPLWGLLLALLALAPAWLVWRQRREASAAAVDPPILVAGAGAALLLAVAAHDWPALDWLAAGWLALAAGGAWCARRLGDKALALVALALAALGGLRLIASVPALWATLLGSLVGEPAFVTGLPAPLAALPLLAVPGALMLIAGRWLPPALPGARRGLTVAGLAVLLVVAYVLFKQIFAIASDAGFAARGFAERTAITQLLFLAGWLVGTGRLPLGRLEERRAALAALLTALAAARLVWFDLLLHNPVLVAQEVGALPVLNLLLPAFLLSAFWLHQARRRSEAPGADVWLLLFLTALVAGTMLMVRQLFQGAILTGGGMPRGEFYGYSLAGLLLAVALLVAGMRRADVPMRIAGLALLTATVLKVFLIDAAALEGLLRILSFLGLGIALIGIGKLYGTVLGRERAGSRG